MRRFDSVVRAAVAALVCAGCAAAPAETEEPSGGGSSTLTYGEGATAGAPDEPPLLDDEAEAEGGSFDRALALGFGEHPPFAHSKRGDRYYEIAVPEGSDGILTFVASAPGDEAPAVAIFDAEHVSLAENAHGAASVAATAGRIYFAKIHGHATRPQYGLSVSFAAVEDAFEPNDAVGSAALIPSNQAIAVRMFAGHETNGGADVDYFRVAADGHRTMRIQLANGEGGNQVYTAEVLAAGENFLGAAHSTGASGDIDASFALPEGTKEVVVKLSAPNAAAASKAIFTVF